MSKSTVHIPPAVLAEQSFVALRSGSSDGICAEPGLDDDVFLESQVPIQEHFFPDYRFHAVFADVLVDMFDKGL